MSGRRPFALPPLAHAGLRWARALGVLVVAYEGIKHLFEVVGVIQPIDGWLAWPLLEIWGYALLFWTSAASLGAAVLARVVKHEARSPLESLARAAPRGGVAVNGAM
jgi:hypothetical protein